MRKFFWICFIVLLGVSLLPQKSRSADTVVFGPTTYKIPKSGTLATSSNFTSSPGFGTVTIVNGDGSGGKKVTSGTLVLNGVTIAGPTELNSGVTTLEKAVTLQAGNSLNVSLSGAFNSYIVVTVKHHSAVDTQAPTITSFTLPATYDAFSVPITSFSATDNVGVTGYLVRESATTPTAGDPGWQATPPTSFTVSSEGSHTLSAWAKDAAENVSSAAFADVLVSISTSPPPTAALTASPTTISPGGSSTLSWTTTNATSASITPDVGSVATNGSVAVTPAATTTYTLTATGTGGTATATATVTVDTGQSQPTTVFGPTTYKIPKSGTLATTSSFTSPPGSGTVTIVNGDGSGGKKVTSGTLVLNGVTIAGPTELNSGVTTLEKAVTLQAGNSLNVSLSGAFNSYIVVTVKHYPGDTTAPSIASFTVPAAHNSFTVPITSFSATDNVGVTGYLVRESATTPTAGDPGWQATPPTSFAVSSEGSHTLSAWAKDAAGNVSARAAATVVVTLPDTQAPTIGTFTIPATHTSFIVPITVFSATDNVGVTGYLVRESTATPTASDPGWVAAPPTSFTVAAEGSRVFTAWAKDAAGNISARAVATVVVTLPDTLSPAILTFAVPVTHNSLTVPITSFSSSDNIGVTGYLVRESTATPVADDPGWLAAPPTSFSVAADGSHTLSAWAKDAAGNVSTGAFADVFVDIGLPTVGQFEVQPLVHVFAIPVQSFVATDDNAVTGYLITATSQTPSLADPQWSNSPPTSFNVSAEGAHTLFAWARDAAGNVSAGASATATIVLQDIVSPVVSRFVLPATNAALDVPVQDFAATDDVGVTAFLVTASAATPTLDDPGWSSTPQTHYVVASEGAHTLYAWAMDAAANLSAGVSATVTVTLADTAPPTVQQFDLPATHDSLVVPVLILTATDNKAVAAYLITETSAVPLAGDPRWQATPPATFGFASAGSHTLYAWARDSAGNVSDGVSDTVTIALSDTVSPTIEVFTLPGTHDALTVPIVALTASDNVGVTGYLITASATAPRPDAAGWRTSPQISFTVAASGTQVLYAWARDAAGNVSLGASSQVLVTASTAASTRIHYFYDALGQLSRVVGDTAGNVYQFDEVGNLLTVATSNTTAAPPVLDSITPNVLLVGKPQLVRITGQNLLTTEVVVSDNPDVLIGYVTVSDTELMAEVSALSPGSATLTVTTAYGAATIGVTSAASSLTISPGQTALLPGSSALLQLTIVPPLPIPVTFKVENLRPAVVSLPAAVTIPASGSTELPVNGLSAGLSMITIGPEKAAVFVELPEQVAIDKLPSRPVSVYVQSSQNLTTSASTGKVSVAVAPSWTGITDAASRRVSVMFDSSKSLSSGASASATGVSVRFDSPVVLPDGATASAKGVSVFLRQNVPTDTSVSSGKVSVCFEQATSMEVSAASGAISLWFATPGENLAVPNVSPGISVAIDGVQ